MLYTDGNGFPLTLKPSHLFGSTERMDAAEVLSAIVEEACLYMPDAPVGEPKVKSPIEAPIKRVKVPKEALSEVDTVPKEVLTVVKVPAVASDLVRNYLN